VICFRKIIEIIFFITIKHLFLSLTKHTKTVQIKKKNIMSLKSYLSPVSKKLKKKSYYYRHFHAAYYVFTDNIRKKKSYSQFGEDLIVYDYLNSKGLLKKDWIYVDIGSNHPTMINDTYLFYKNGFRGICLEPNLELAQFYSQIRPGDIMINAAAGENAGIVKFYQTDNPVFSSIHESELEDTVSKVCIVPMVTIDDLLKQIKFDVIFYFKTDTEGNDLSVIKGASDALKKVLILEAETLTDNISKEMLDMLGIDWEILRSQNRNTIFVNSKLISSMIAI